MPETANVMEGGVDYLRNILSNSRIPERKKLSNDELGKQEFLLLLLTQLKNQDPTNPLDDRAMIAQLAQFSSLEQMQNLNTSITEYMRAQSRIMQISAVNMIGGKVTALVGGSENSPPVSVIGKVTGVKFDSEPVLIVGEHEVRLSEVVSIGE